MWSEQSVKDKQPYGQKAAELKEKYEKTSPHTVPSGKPAAGKGPWQAGGFHAEEGTKGGGGGGGGHRGRITGYPVVTWAGSECSGNGFAENVSSSAAQY